MTIVVTLNASVIIYKCKACSRHTPWTQGSILRGITRHFIIKRSTLPQLLDFKLLILPDLRVEVSVIDVLVVQIGHPSANITGQIDFLSPAEIDVNPGQQLLQTASANILGVEEETAWDYKT